MTRSLRHIGAALLGAVAALALATVALAGGWSVVVLDQASASLAAGELTAGAPFTIGFTVLQHGKHPVDGLSPRITLTPQDGGETITVLAEAASGPGRYQAQILLPAAGAWAWQIDAFGPPATLAPLRVVAPAPTAAAPLTFTLPWPWLALLAALALMAALLTIHARRSPAPAPR